MSSCNEIDFDHMDEPNVTNTKALRFGLIVAIIFLGISLAVVGDYGLTWDEPENVLSGTHYVKFFTTWDWTWLDFEHYNEVYASNSDPPKFYRERFKKAERYPPVANMVVVLTHALFTEQLGWLPTTDGYHVGVLLFGSLAVFVVAVFTRQAFGSRAGYVATLALMLCPLFFEHTHYNMKDVPFAALVMLAVWSYWKAVKEQRRRWLWFSACATGLALGTRTLAAEVWGVIGLAYLPTAWDWLRQCIHQRRWHAPPLALRWLPLHVLISVLVFLAVWPWLWIEPVERLTKHLKYSQRVARGAPVLYGGQVWEAGKTLPWHYSLVLFLITTPPLTLFWGIFGAGITLKRGRHDRDSAALILVVLFALALVRSSWPTIAQYDGIRHIMDGIVAFACLCGLGVDAFWRWFRQRWPRLSSSRWSKGMQVGIVVLACLPVMVHLYRLHPYQGVYYNFLVGGVPSAEGRYPLEYWGSSYRAGCTWLNEHIPEGEDAIVLSRIASHLVRYCLRPGLREAGVKDLESMPSDRTVYLIYITRIDRYDGMIEFAEAYLSPMYEVTADGVPLLKIIRTDAGTLTQSEAE